MLDTGVDKNHPSLAGQVISEACFNSNTSIASSRCPGGATQPAPDGSNPWVSDASVDSSECDPADVPPGP